MCSGGNNIEWQVGVELAKLSAMAFVSRIMVVLERINRVALSKND